MKEQWLLKMLMHPQVNYKVYFEVMRDFRKGGLKPEIYNAFIQVVDSLPQSDMRKYFVCMMFKHFNLKEITEAESEAILNEVVKRTIEKNKTCFHPEAGKESCGLDYDGKIKASRAHSAQRAILKNISLNGQVAKYSLSSSQIPKQINIASIFYGFCNTHDAIFKPIETEIYSNTPQQNFLFAYRSWAFSTHKKIERSNLKNFGEQWQGDVQENKKLFDGAILKNKYDIIKTEKFELNKLYPIAGTGCFYLEYDFDGNEILHSEDRMEFVFISIFPSNNKTYFLLSYFKSDESLYGALGKQIRKRDNLLSDISILLCHSDNIYFHPDYFNQHIKIYFEKIRKVFFSINFEIKIDDFDKGTSNIQSENYLENPDNINFFAQS